METKKKKTQPRIDSTAYGEQKSVVLGRAPFQGPEERANEGAPPSAPYYDEQRRRPAPLCALASPMTKSRRPIEDDMEAARNTRMRGCEYGII